MMKAKKTVGVLLTVMVVVAVHAEVIVQDFFTGMSAGDNVSNSVLEVGSGTWAGSLESNGGNIMRAPASPGLTEGASIALPDFNVGDIITIKARAAETDSTTAWFGIGFSDSSDVLSTLGNNTPWATFTAATGNVNVFGGTSTQNGTGLLTRSSGAVGTVPTLMEFIYDTGAGTVTTIYGGETVQDGVSITTSGTPTLDHAFFVMRSPAGGGPPGSYLVDFEVSVIPEPATLGLIGISLSGLFVVRRLAI